MGHADLPPDAVTDGSGARPPIASVIAWFLMVLGVIYMVALGGGAFIGLYSTPLRIISVVGLTFALAVWLVLAWRRPFWRPNSSFALALLVSFAALAIALLLSERPRLGADYLAYAALLTGAYLLQQRLFAHAFFGPRLGSLAILLGFALGIVYVIRVFGFWLDFWRQVGRLTVPPFRPGFEGLAFGHPGTFATVMILLWLASVAHLGLTTNRSRIVAVLLGLLVIFVVISTGARGAWLGIAAAVVAVAAVWLLARERRQALAGLLRSGRVRVGVGASAVALAVVGVILFPAIANRLAAGGDQVRAAFYAAALRMFQDDPVTGLGPGMWVVERARYTLPTEQDYYIPHAHNLYLQTLAELGIVGALAGVVVLIALARLVWLGIRSSDALAQRLGWTSLIALVYLGVHQLVDFYPNMAALGFLLALLIARLDALMPAVTPWNASIGSAAPPVLGRRVAVIALGLATVLSTGWLLRTEAAALDGQQATDAANTGDWPAALDAARRAVAADPELPPYLFTQGLAAAHAGKLEEARGALRKAAEIDDFPTAWLDVAQVELELGNEDAARDALSRAMRLGFQNPQTAFGAMKIYEALGDTDAAVSAGADALLVTPSLASEPTWTSIPSLQAIRAAAVFQALERVGPDPGYRIALEADMPDEARAMVARLPESSRALPELIVAAWTGDETAFDELHARAIDNPLDTGIVGICHRVASRSRESDWQGPRDWICDQTPAVSDPVVRVGGPPEARVALPGPDATWHHQYVHRRLTPNDELVPGLPHLEVEPGL
jgi:O-antigen ligase